jgi:hypothetical protein
MGTMSEATLLSRVVRWIVNGCGLKPEPRAIEAAAAAKYAAASNAEGYDAWLDFLAHRDPLQRRAGMSAHDEFEEWIVTRDVSRAAPQSGTSGV